MIHIPARFCNPHRTGLTESDMADKLKFNEPLTPLARAVFYLRDIFCERSSWYDV
jgi:hypothetical protein